MIGYCHRYYYSCIVHISHSILNLDDHTLAFLFAEISCIYICRVMRRKNNFMYMCMDGLRQY